MLASVNRSEIHLSDLDYVELPPYRTLWKGCYYRNTNMLEQPYLIWDLMDTVV